ncbi:MAG: adenylate/guanylate cyclase domain-containing protein, partial [Candidatus Dormibacteria bacterium]
EAARTAGVDLSGEPAASALSLAAAEGSTAPTSSGDIERLGSREVTVLVADVRATGEPSRGGADPMEALRRWAALAIEQHHGVVDEFAGDVVMATFNVSGRYPAHARQAVEAALELVRTGVRLDRAVAAGIASGDAIIGRVRQSDRVTVVGDAANLAARLHAEARGGEILLSESSFAALGSDLPTGLGAPERCSVSITGLEAPAAAVRLALAAPAAVATGPAAADAAHGRLAREAEFWSMTYGGSVVRLKDAKGVRDLARLLANPGTEIAAVDLAGAAVPVSSSRARAGSDLDLRVEGDAGEVLDERARAEYRQRLIDLEADLAEAEDANDPERASRVRQEREFIIDELGAAVGLMGKSRRVLDPAERARKAVTWRLRETIGRIEAAQPALGRHLRLSVRTGTFCVYDPATPTRWYVTA